MIKKNSLSDEGENKGERTCGPNDGSHLTLVNVGSVDCGNIIV